MIAEALRRDILNGLYKAGRPLRQDRIAEEMGVSKIPLREALVQLKAEGLVEFRPRRGALVSELTSSEAEEIFTMRIALESAAISKAIPHLSNSDFIRAKSVLDIIDSEEDRSQWGDLNWEFHSTLYKAARMPRLLNTIFNLHNNVTRYLILYLDQLSASDQSQKEHRAMLNACRAGKTDEAVKVLVDHLERASKRLMLYLP